MKPLAHTAILVFSRLAQEEAQSKGYVHLTSKKRSTQIASELITYTIQQAKQTGLPLFTLYSDQQQGKSFGERLANSIEFIYAKGFDNLIVIGTDTPNITCKHLQQAAIHLQTHSLILGPSTDGGVYLIGLNRKAYQREAFISIPWLTAVVSLQLKYYALQQQASLFLLRSEADLDTAASLLEWVKESQSHQLALQITELAFDVSTLTYTGSNFFSIVSINATKDYLRGPPAFVVCC